MSGSWCEKARVCLPKKASVCEGEHVCDVER